jgi:hypothetical protein
LHSIAQLGKGQISIAKFEVVDKMSSRDAEGTDCLDMAVVLEDSEEWPYMNKDRNGIIKATSHTLYAFKTNRPTIKIPPWEANEGATLSVSPRISHVSQ